VVFYGDNFNWWAAYALWVTSLFGHPDARLLDGGRTRWVADGRPLTTEPAAVEPAHYPVVERDEARIRAFKDEVLAHARGGGQLIDVRSPAEFTGELLAMPDYPQEGALRGGHIPGAANLPWRTAANDDGTFKDAATLRGLYVEQVGLRPDRETIAYCRIGERSSHTWFVLTHLLGFERVRNYDGSWVEWGNSVRVPIERGP
jgi:thiosulfate/3-mercaptopyruvate sulfurtransferase